MEGYLWKRGRQVPHTMKRRFAVLKSTMLAFYPSQEAAQHTGAIPTRVLEVVGVQAASPSRASDHKHPALMTVQYLDDAGSGVLQCRADSREAQQIWLTALQHALEEPDRLAQEEIAEAQRELQRDAETHSHAVQKAAEAVQAAGKQQQEQARSETALQQSRKDAAELSEQLENTRVLHREAHTQLQMLRQALDDARHRVHASALSSEDFSDQEQASDPAAQSVVERLAAQVEVAASSEASLGHTIEKMELQISELDSRRQELEKQVQRCMEESRTLRETAATSLENAQRAKHRSRRLASWSSGDGHSGGRSGTPSHLDPLAEGYLLCKHPTRNSMHRRYYVLVGNTLCWYADQDAYVTKMDAPSGVVHIADVSEWDGKLKPGSPLRKLVTPSFSKSGSSPVKANSETYPHTFGVITVEGKTLHCSAPMRQSRELWISALHVGLTMPPLSPHRALAAKARRDSFDLLASTTFKLRRRASFDGEIGEENDEEKSESPASPSASHSVSLEDSSRSMSELADSASLKDDSKLDITRPKLAGATKVVVEGYLVKKSSLTPVMKKKYCVLNGLSLRVFASHAEADASRASTSPKKSEHNFHVSGVSDWDGHTALMHYHHGFQLQTVEHHTIYCSAPSTQDKVRWLRGVHEALLHHHSDGAPDTELKELNMPGDAMKKSDSQSTYATARREFLVILQRFYAEHHPSKLGDVPMLLSRYQRREQALVEHLDRLYSTSMAQDSTVQSLLKTLSGPTPPTSPRRPSLGASNPSSPSTRSASHISDWLTWNNEIPASFCVLEGHRLERFESQENRTTGAPMSVFLVAGVHDYPAPSPSVKSSDQQLRFFLSGVYENFDQQQVSGAASTELLVLETTTMEAKQRWMAKLRSGLGFLSETQAHTPTSAASPQRLETNAFREKVIAFYKEHNPRHVDEVDALLACFAGRERQLLASLDATYATNISSDSSFESVLPPPPHSSSIQGDLDSEIHREGYLWVKHPQMGADFRKCFCVLHGVSWKCFASSSEAYQDASAQTLLLDDTVVCVHAVTAKLAEAQTFHLETQTSGVIVLYTDVAELVHDWTQALHSVVTKHRQTAELDDEDEDKESASQRLHELLTSFFEKHNPTKCDEVPTLLHGFQGREMALLEQLDTVYKSHLVEHPLAKSLVKELAEQYTKEAAQSSSAGAVVDGATAQDEAVLMEGYLLKRGHRNPSMRKRYCVLIGAELSYFATHNDSRNDSGGVTSARLGSFQVDVVGEWSGKTSTHTYEHGMELETSDGKAYFCAASSTQEKQQWMDAFRHGIALVRSKRQEESNSAQGEEGQDPGVAEHKRHQREQFRDKLAQFYREKNPNKVADLELLLSCYSGREVALLQAIDGAYGTALAADESLLALLPSPPEQATALETLQLDGYLKRTSGDSSSRSMWKRAQSVYVALDGLTLSFFASREGFKSGGAGMGEVVTVLALKDSDEHHPPSPRFSVETSEHQWFRFEARDAMEKRLWVQVIRAALDAVLAQSLLAEEQRTVQKELTDGADTDVQGFLLVRLDFTCSQEEHWRKRLNPVLIGERYVTLTNSNELAITKDKDTAEEQAQFRVASTRAWTPGAGCWPVAAGHREPRFPFQIVTQEQFVLSCSAATDVERAWWIRHLRLGAEQAAALEMLEEQLLETKAPLSPGRRSWREIQRRSSKSSLEEAEVVVPMHNEAQAQSGEEEPPMTGYLFFRLAETPQAAGQAATVSRTESSLREAFVVLTMRAHVSLYDDEAAYYRRDQPICMAQAAELVHEGPASLTTRTQSQKSPSRLRHLFPCTETGEAQAAAATSHAFAVLLLPLEAQVSLGDSASVNTGAQVLELFPSLTSQRELWLEAFASRIDLVRGEALLADEKLLLRLEEDSEEDVKEAGTGGPLELQLDVAEPAEDTVSDGTTTTFAFRAASMEGMLTPWRTSSSPIRIPGSSKMKPVDNVYAVLVGCQLRCFESKAIAEAAAAGSEDAKPSLDVEVASFLSWEAPIASWLTANKTKEGLGFQVDVVGSRHGMCFTAVTGESKRQWLHVLQHELDFALAERYLDEDAREFTREVAEHLAATTSSTEASRSISRDDGCADVDRDGEVDAGVTRTQGYLRVRHHNLGSVWHERYAVLNGSTLAIFADSSMVKAHTNSSDSLAFAMEMHEVAGVAKWHATFSGFSRGDTTSLKRSGFCVETSAGGFLECTAASDKEGDKWRQALAEAIAKTESRSSSTASRDPALPFIPGARMEGYLKLKESPSSKKLAKLTAIQLWKTRYCVVLGAHWLEYVNQKQAVSTNENPSTAHPVAVHELLGTAALAGEEENASHEFAIAVATGGHVHCRARSSLERKRWMNAIQDELQSDAQTGAEISRSQVAREEKLAARAAVKSKLQEMQSDARRQSLLLGEALQFARGDSNSDSDWESDEQTSDKDGETTRRQRTRSDYIDCSPESSPMRRHLADKAFAFDGANTRKPCEPSSNNQQTASTSFGSFFACVFRCLPLGGPASGTGGRSAVAPLGVPGFPSTAAACSTQYICDYYQADGYQGDEYRGLPD